MKKFKINIVDVLVIALIILMAVAIKVRFKKYNSVDSSSSVNTKIVYEIKFSSVREYTVNAFKEGDKLFDNASGVEIGTITSKTATPAKVYVGLSDGTTVESTTPEKFDLVIGVETEGIISDEAYYAGRTVELKVGSEKVFETLYAKSTGRISKIVESNAPVAP